MAYDYKIMYDDGDWIGLCEEYPSLSFVADSYTDAYIGIKKLVKVVEKEVKDE